MLLLLFRELSGHQQREQIIKMQALFEANRIIKMQLNGRELNATSNEAVRAAFRDVPSPRKNAASKRKGQSRDGDSLMGDFPEE